MAKVAPKLVVSGVFPTDKWTKKTCFFLLKDTVKTISWVNSHNGKLTESLKIWYFWGLFPIEIGKMSIFVINRAVIMNIQLSICICMYVYVRVCMYGYVVLSVYPYQSVCRSLGLHVCLYVLSACLYACLYDCISLYDFVCMHICVCICVYKYVYVCTTISIYLYVCTYVCVCLCIYVYIWMYIGNVCSVGMYVSGSAYMYVYVM